MDDASLEHTPTWVVAAVCFAIVSVSLAAERFLHYLGKACTPSSLNAICFVYQHSLLRGLNAVYTLWNALV
jgi:mlo protein